jgi:hypothetical protein
MVDDEIDQPRFARMRAMITSLVFGASLITAAAVHAQTYAAYSDTLTNGTTADANQVMANFNSILSCVDGLFATPPALGSTTPNAVTASAISEYPSGESRLDGRAGRQESVQLIPTGADCDSGGIPLRGEQ